MEPLITATKTSITTMEFFELKNHPSALRFVRKTDGRFTGAGAVPRATVVALQKEGVPIVEFYETYDEAGYRTSRDKNAVFWAVPKDVLSTTRDLFDFCREGVGEHLDDPDYVLVFKSNWDHQIWDIDGKRIWQPIEVTLRGTQFNLDEVARHLAGRKGVVSFEIKPNPTRQNWKSSGTHQGHLVVDLGALTLPEGAAVTRTWIEDHILYGFHGPEHDYLGLHKFAMLR